jgi:hypothetical protein
MAVVNQVSDQLTLLDAGKKQAVATEGRSYKRYFSITSVAGDATSVLRLAKLYAGERILHGWIAAEISGAATATLALGITGSTSKFLAATAIDAALAARFAHTPLLAMGELQTADGEIIATIGTAGLLAGHIIAGWVEVMRP